jgi:hypothetical protein
MADEIITQNMTIKEKESDNNNQIRKQRDNGTEYSSADK